MISFKKILVIVFTIALASSCRVRLEPVQILTFKERLEQLFPEARVVAIETNSTFEKVFKITINQPFDESNLEQGFFKQEVYLQHINEQKPLVLISQNPNVDLKTKEVTKLLNANQVSVVNRFVIDSIPKSFKTVKLASKDIHKIITELRKIYSGKWISFGENNNGLFTLNHRATYPWDVEVTIVKNPDITQIELKVADFLSNNGKKIVYLSSTNQLKSFAIKPHVDALKIQLENANAISALNESDYNRFIEKLKMWLGYQVEIIN
jgi:hypothetical protein